MIHMMLHIGRETFVIASACRKHFTQIDNKSYSCSQTQYKVKHNTPDILFSKTFVTSPIERLLWTPLLPSSACADLFWPPAVKIRIQPGRKGREGTLVIVL